MRQTRLLVIMRTNRDEKTFLSQNMGLLTLLARFGSDDKKRAIGQTVHASKAA